jgi:hypothetical protein
MPASFVCCYVQAGRETPMDAILELPRHCGEKFQKEQAEGKYYRQPSTLEAVSCTTTCINMYQHVSNKRDKRRLLECRRQGRAKTDVFRAVAGETLYIRTTFVTKLSPPVLAGGSKSVAMIIQPKTPERHTACPILESPMSSYSYPMPIILGRRPA